MKTFAIIIFVAGTLLDYGTTKTALSRGLREGNPILGSKEPRLSLIFWGVSLIVFGLAWAVQMESLKAAIVIWLIAGLFHGLCGLLNIRTMERYK